MNAPGTKGVGDAREFFERRATQHSWSCVDVVYIAAVDADRGEQTCVVVDARQVATDGAFAKEDRTACIAALDASIGIVPLVYPSHGGGGRLRVVEVVDLLKLCHAAKQCKRAVENAALVGACDNDIAVTMHMNRIQPESVAADAVHA